ncbi:hypothetical protein K439DRAFT_1545665 [Ramaria rubella]|nr:hypothetical protein K439DRAFT_1545665 [Ramaria rubella]
MFCTLVELASWKYSVYKVMPPLHIHSTTLQTFHISFLTMSSQEELATIIQEQSDFFQYHYNYPVHSVRCSTSFPETEFMIHVSVDTLNGVFTILFNTAVFVAITENTIGLLQLQRGISGFQRSTLSKLLVHQVSDKTLTFQLANPSVNHKPFPKLVLSTIIICRFHLDLQQRNDYPNGSNTSHSLPLNSFHAVTERIHRAVVDEFGDLSFNESFGTEVSQEDIELQEIQSPSGVAEIDLQEFPWAGGDIGGEEAGLVASGSGILRE